MPQITIAAIEKLAVGAGDHDRQLADHGFALASD
jgi:hypothetical protein